MVSLHSNSKVTKIPDQRVSEFIQFQVQLGAGNPKQSFIVETQQCAMNALQKPRLQLPAADGTFSESLPLQDHC